MKEDRDPGVFGRNVRMARRWFGWSMRELSERSGVGRRTIVRIEQGRGCNLKTEQRISQAWNMSLGLLWDPDLALSESQKVIGPDDGRWLFGYMDEGKRYLERQSKVLETPSSIVSLDPDSIQDEAERLRLGLAGLSRGFVKSMSCNLGNERHVAGISEVYGKDVNSGIAGNKYMLFILEGGLRIEMRGQTYDVPEQGAFFFDGGEDWTAEPWEGQKGPTRLFYLCLTAKRLGRD